MLTVPHSCVGNLIGKQGVKIKSLETNAGLQEIRFDKSEHYDPSSPGRTVILIGNTTSCAVGCYLIFRALHERAGLNHASAARTPGPTYEEWMETVSARGPKPVFAPPAVPNLGGQYASGPPSHPPANWSSSPHSDSRAPAYAPTSYAPSAYPPSGFIPPAAYAPVGFAPAPYAPQSNMPPSYPEYPRYPNQVSSMPSVQAGGDSVAVEMQCPCDKVGRIIGKAGAMIKELESKSGTMIKINQDLPVGQPRIVTIKGPAMSVAIAKELISSLIAP